MISLTDGIKGDPSTVAIFHRYLFRNLVEATYSYYGDALSSPRENLNEEVFVTVGDWIAIF